MQSLNISIHSENYKFFYNCNSNKMDYRQKIVVPQQQNKKNDDEEDEDLEALRLAALQSLRTKHTVHSRRQTLPQAQKIVPQVTQASRLLYKGQRPPRRGYFHNRLQQRQNGEIVFASWPNIFVSGEKLLGTGSKCICFTKYTQELTSIMASFLAWEHHTLTD